MGLMRNLRTLAGAKFVVPLCAWMLVACAVAVVFAQDDVKTTREVVATLLDETVVRGRVTELSAQRVTLQSGEQSRSIAAEQLATIELGPASGATRGAAEVAATIELVDGSTILASEWTMAGGTARWKSPLDAAGETAGRDLRVVRLQAISDALRERWTQIAAAEAAGDRIVIRKGDATLDSVEGIVRGVTADKVQFEIDGDVSQVDRKRVFALFFYQKAGRKLEKAACSVTDSGGMKLAAASLTLAGDEVTITTPAGQTLKRPLQKLVRIDFATAKTTYLSDLKPESTEWTPYVGTATAELAQLFAPKADRALFDGALQLPRRQGQRYSPAWTYAKGLSLHSRTKVVYRLPREFRTFSAIAGIDSRMRPSGHVQLVIHGDDKQLFSGAISGKDDPQTLSIDVAGVRRLTIFVDYGEGLDVGDHLNLCDARLVE